MNVKKIKWCDVTLDQYEQIEQILSSSKEDVDKYFTIASLLYNLDLNEIKIREIGDYTQSIYELMNSPFEIRKAQRKYTINGTTYVVTKKEDITTSQFMDYNEIASNLDDNIKKLLAIALVPEGHKYNDGYDLEQAVADMGQLPVTDVNDIVFFLVGLLKRYVKHFLTYTIAQTQMDRKMPKQTKKAIVRTLWKVCRSMDY